MANMYPKNIAEYMPTDSERIVYQELKNQLPDSFDVFYSVEWTSYENGALIKSEADFIVASHEYGYLCLEVKGGSGIRIVDNIWYVLDTIHGERRLNISPYEQAEKSMYFFSNKFSNKYNTRYQGIFGAGVIFPFYPVDDEMSLDNRNRTCTIDGNDLNNILPKIKKMFKLWGGKTFGRRFYSRTQHEAFLELVRERIAISAAAGALVKYKEQQINVINRVQDNYIYFLSNVRQFYIHGGAGTGKTWIAMKMAAKEAEEPDKSVLFVCMSLRLANMVKEHIGRTVEVLDSKSLFEKTVNNFESFYSPHYEGILSELKDENHLYDAIFVDEAQDFTYELAQIIRRLLRDKLSSRFGIFYDDVQVLRNDSFGDGFEIDNLPFLLHENIRNTSNIYNWTSDKTNLGCDMIANPVEGPTPMTETVHESGQLTLTLESLFRKYLDDEHLPNDALTILTDDIHWFSSKYETGIAKWSFVNGATTAVNEISFYSIEDFKGLESDMVVYIRSSNTSENINYIAYTRAKYYLIEIVRNY